MRFNVAPIDSAILGLVQLLQPTFAQHVYEESHGTVLERFLNKGQLLNNLERLEQTGFLLRTADGQLVVAPKGYELVSRGLDAKDRDKARLLSLNRQHYQ